MKKTPRQWIGYLALFFWFFCGMRIGAFLLAPRMMPPGAGLSALQRSFFARGITIDVGIAAALTLFWLAELTWERKTKQARTKP